MSAPTPRTDAWESDALSVVAVRGKYAKVVYADKARELERDLALATDVIHKCNAWIAEAKPLLEKGGNAERELAAEKAHLDALVVKLKNHLTNLRSKGSNWVGPWEDLEPLDAVIAAHRERRAGK